MTRVDAAHVGTAGWAIAKRYAAAFPSTGSALTRYAERLGAAEVNSSFHRPHRTETYARWATSVPDDFRFAVKLPKTITHGQRLDDCDALVERFVSEVAGLGPKLAVVLVQLPPSLAFDEPCADRFFDTLRRRTAAALACEPRHGSWFQSEPEQLLIRWQVARVAADPARVPEAGRPGGWDGLRYYRLHGSPDMYRSDYSRETLDRLAVELADADTPTWCIFDNTTLAHALGNALDLKGRLVGSGESQAAPPPRERPIA